MADWTELDINTLLPGEPVTSAIMLALEENPRAIAEGATGAPKIADKIVSGAGTTTVSGLDDFGGMIIHGVDRAFSSSSSVTSKLEIEYSTNNGSTFSTPQTLFTKTVGSGSTGGEVLAKVDIYIDFATASYKGVAATASGNSTLTTGATQHLTGTVTGLTSDVTDIRLSGFQALLINPQGGDTAS